MWCQSNDNSGHSFHITEKYQQIAKNLDHNKLSGPFSLGTDSNHTHGSLLSSGSLLHIKKIDRRYFP